jgi:hypothetical protein
VFSSIESNRGGAAENPGADRRRGLFKQAQLDLKVRGVRSSSLFRRQRRLDKELDVVSTGIHGGAAAMNK